MRCFLIVCLGLFALTAKSETGAPPYREVTKKLDELYRSTSATGKMELFSKTETQSRHLKMHFWAKGQDKTLIVINEPARESGISTLKVGTNIWNYLPKISRTIRIPPSMMMSSWMGTDLSNDDLVKDTLYESDFDVLAGVESKDPEGWLYVMNVKPGIVGRWQKIDWVVRKSDLLPLQAKYFDRKGRLARIIRFSEIKELGGKTIPTSFKVVPVDEPGHETEIRYLEISFGVPIEDSKFSLSELERK